MAAQARINAHLPRLDGMIGTSAGFGVTVLTTVVAVAAGAAAHPVAGLVGFAVVAAIMSVLTTLPGALATAGWCWACDDGFLVGRHADLVFTHASLVGAIVLVGVAVLGTALGVAGRLVIALHDSPLSAELPRAREWSHI
ncbi:MAG TPA: hypothetical protein VHW44_26000 [Pseudonocardiaceae bacterium]|nr:hypothetical protein [Pseudonocardiaceae bacterium]